MGLMPDQERPLPAWAEYPQRSCREPVWSLLGTAGLCRLPESAGTHPGPHATPDIPSSVSARQDWEQTRAAATQESK